VSWNLRSLHSANRTATIATSCTIDLINDAEFFTTPHILSASPGLRGLLLASAREAFHSVQTKAASLSASALLWSSNVEFARSCSFGSSPALIQVASKKLKKHKRIAQRT
jgi:hypothetical protein